MHEHIARVLYYFEIHLLYASLAGSAAWLLTALPRGSATSKYWIWVAAALNFIVPAGAVMSHHTPPVTSATELHAPVSTEREIATSVRMAATPSSIPAPC